MGGSAKPAGFHTLSSELLAVLLQHIPSQFDRHSLFCTCTDVRDTMLQSMGLPHGPQLECRLHASGLQLLSYEQLCMHLWRKRGPRLMRACNTAVRAAGCVQLSVVGYAATSAQLTQLMAVGTWQQLTGIHLQSLLVDQLVPDVLARHCPHLHTLHLVSTCRVLGLGVPTDVLTRATTREGLREKGNAAYDLQQHVLSCPSRTILNLLRPTPCPQLRHLTLDVRSVWPEVQRLYTDENGTRADLIRQMESVWFDLDTTPRGIIKLKLAELHASDQQEKQQLAAAVKALKAARHEAYDREVEEFEDLIADLEDRQQEVAHNYESTQPGQVVDWGAVSNAAREVMDSSMPTDNSGDYSSSMSVADTLKQGQLLQSELVGQQWRRLVRQQRHIQEKLDSFKQGFAKQGAGLDAWRDVHSQLVRCNDNAQYAQQLHNALQPQVQQQLAALPNLSSLHIKEGTDAPPGLAEGVLQLGSQITALKLGTAETLSSQSRHRTSPDDLDKLVMPQQLNLLCSQLTNLQQLQWDAVVDDEGMHHLLKLPHLQHVTLVTNLSQSFAGAQCSWHTLTTMHSEPSKSNSTCKQLAYLPLASLQQPVRVVRCSDMDLANSYPQSPLFAIKRDPDVQLATVKSACSNVARCGGVSWVYNFKTHEQDIPCIVFQLSRNTLKPGCKPSLQQLQVLEASLPLLQGDSMQTVALACTPLDDSVMSVLAPQLIAWGVHTLDIRHSNVCDECIPHLLGLLPRGITHLLVGFESDKVVADIVHCFSEASLTQLCAGATRPIAITLTSGRIRHYGSCCSQWVLERMSKACPLVDLLVDSK